MKMAEDSMSNGEDKIQFKVTTLCDLKQRREALLAKKKCILKRINTEKLAEVGSKHNKLAFISLDSVSDSAGEAIAENLTQVEDIVSLETSFDEEIALADTMTFRSSSIFQGNNVEDEKENEPNVINISNIEYFTEFRENSSSMCIDNNSVINIATIELMPDVTLKNNILSEETPTVNGSSSSQVELNITADNILVDSTIFAVDETSSFQTDEVLANDDISSLRPIEVEAVVETSNSQPNEVAAIGETSNPQLNEISAVSETEAHQSDEMSSSDTYHGDLSINRKRKNKAKEAKL